MMRNWFREYKNSLKLIDVEEVLDLLFYRPLAFLFVKIIYRFNVTPNQITILAIISAVVGAILFVQNYIIVAGILLILYDVFDCADGMVARLKKNGTPLGRIIDGFADYIATGAAYLAIGFGFASKSDSPSYFWVLTLLSAASNIFHAISLDYYRNRYLDYYFNRKSLLGDDLKEHLAEYERLKIQEGKYFSKLMYKIYFLYSKLQLKITVKENAKTAKIFRKDDFLKKNKLMIRLWTFIGPTTEWSFLIIALVTNSLEYYFVGMIVVLNIYAIFLHLAQTYINGKTEKV